MVIYVIIKKGTEALTKLKRELYFFSSFTRSIDTIEEFYNNLDIYIQSLILHKIY